MDELQAIRAVMTDEQRAWHDLLCEALARGVLTQQERETLPELAASDQWPAFVAELQVRVRMAREGGGNGVSH